MSRNFAKAFYNSKAWKECRDGFYVSKHGLCERCSGPGLIVHHRTYLTPENINDPSVALNWENLELVCQSCHNDEHHGGQVTQSGLTFDEDGNLVATRQ